MDEHVIDLEEYVRRKEEEDADRTTFAIWGAEGERARFALPLWRAAYLAGGTRAALAWELPGERPDRLRPHVVLDLASDPARREIPGGRVDQLREEPAPPALERTEEAVAVFLGQREGRRWYLVIDHLKESPDRGAVARDDLYFLAGECAGLLFHRQLDADAGGS